MMELSGISLDCIPRESRHWAGSRNFSKSKRDVSYRILHSRKNNCILSLLRLNVPVNNFSVMSGWSHSFLGITSTFGE